MKTRRRPAVAAWGLLAWLYGWTLVAPAMAESIASSASSAGSASVGSLSDSSQGSSNASSPAGRVAEGDYRVIEVAAAPDHAERLRLTLQRVEASGEGATFWLDMPQPTWVATGLGRGDVLSARHRDYGLVIARADTRQAIFLLLADPWRRQLDPAPVTL